MKIKRCKQNDNPILISDPKDNPIIDMNSNHVEITLEDKSILIIPSVHLYYDMLGDPNIFNGTKEIYLENLLSHTEITKVDYESEYYGSILFVCKTKYNDEDIYLLRPF